MRDHLSLVMIEFISLFELFELVPFTNILLLCFLKTKEEDAEYFARIKREREDEIISKPTFESMTCFRPYDRVHYFMSQLGIAKKREAKKEAMEKGRR